MGKLKSIREFFWPLLEKADEPESKIQELTEEAICTPDFQGTLQQAIKLYETESKRNQTIEQKSSIFIGTISVVTSIAIGITTLFANSDEFSFFSYTLFFLLFVFIIYISRTLWFSLKTLERKTFCTISIEDFLLAESDENYYKKTILKISKKVKENYKVINEKVDNMTMAQEYFKRSIVVIFIYAFLIFIYYSLEFLCG